MVRLSGGFPQAGFSSVPRIQHGTSAPRTEYEIRLLFGDLTAVYLGARIEMSADLTPSPEEQQKANAALQRLGEQLWAIVPEWLRKQSRLTVVAIATALRLIIYMVLHWMIGIAFVHLIASDFPRVRRFVDDLSVSIFVFLIGKSLLELAWEEIPKRKKGL